MLLQQVCHSNLNHAAAFAPRPRRAEFHAPRTTFNADGRERDIRVIR
jgi:hypothetical protein